MPVIPSSWRRCDRRSRGLATDRLPPRSSFVLQGLGHKRPDGHFHQLEREWDGPADMNFMLIIREHDVEARSDHLHGIAVRRPIHPMDPLPESMLGRADRPLEIRLGCSRAFVHDQVPYSLLPSKQRGPGAFLRDVHESDTLTCRRSAIRPEASRRHSVKPIISTENPDQEKRERNSMARGIGLTAWVSAVFMVGRPGRAKNE